MTERVTSEQFHEMLAKGAKLVDTKRRPCKSVFGAKLVSLEDPIRTHIGIKVYTKIISINHAYYTGKDGKRHLTKKGREFKKAIYKAVLGRIEETTWYLMQISFGYPLFTRTGEVRDRDTTNAIKLTEDSFCEALGRSDKHVKKIIVEKVDSKDEFVAVDIWSWPDK